MAVPYSTLKENLAKILEKEGYVEKIEIVDKEFPKTLVLTLLPLKKKEKIEVKRISKPGRRVYVKAKDLPLLRRGLGFTIISTPLGLMTDKEAIKKKVGGEVICKII